MQTAIDKHSEMIEKIRNYLATQPVEKAWLFGSFARGEETTDSDVDILVNFGRFKPVGLFKYAGIYIGLKDALNKEVDLVEDGTLFPFAAESANREKILIYERKN